MQSPQTRCARGSRRHRAIVNHPTIDIVQACPSLCGPLGIEPVSLLNAYDTRAYTLVFAYICAVSSVTNSTAVYYFSGRREQNSSMVTRYGEYSGYFLWRTHGQASTTLINIHTQYTPSMHLAMMTLMPSSEQSGITTPMMVLSNIRSIINHMLVSAVFTRNIRYGVLSTS